MIRSSVAAGDCNQHFRGELDFVCCEEGLARVDRSHGESAFVHRDVDTEKAAPGTAGEATHSGRQLRHPHDKMSTDEEQPPR
jgi:hypothetical protein